jgi:hypothetical protein
MSAELEAELAPVQAAAAAAAETGGAETDAVVTTPLGALTPRLPASLASQLRAHYLVLVVLALNHLGEGARCAARVKELHALLDAEGEGDGGASGSMAGLGGGLLEVRSSSPQLWTCLRAVADQQASACLARQVPFGNEFGNEGDSLLLAFTPPQTLYVLACLVTALAKRDPTGKRPKKRLFAEEGLRQLAQSDSGPACAFSRVF